MLRGDRGALASESEPRSVTLAAVKFAKETTCPALSRRKQFGSPSTKNQHERRHSVNTTKSLSPQLKRPLTNFRMGAIFTQINVTSRRKFQAYVCCGITRGRFSSDYATRRWRREWGIMGNRSTTLAQDENSFLHTKWTKGVCSQMRNCSRAPAFPHQKKKITLSITCQKPPL